MAGLAPLGGVQLQHLLPLRALGYTLQVVYGHPLPALLPYTAGTARTETVDTLLKDREVFLAEVHDRLLQAQAYAKKHYDAHHRPLEFAIND